MSDPVAEKIISAVEARFEVRGIERDLESIRLQVEEGDHKEEFVALSQEMNAMNLVTRIVKGYGGTYIIINRLPPRRTRRFLSSPWVPRILFGVVVAFVMTNGYYRTLDANHIIYIGEPVEMAIIFTLALLGILGVHELGHMAVGKIHKLKATWPYFIPGYPLGGIPTFGAIIFQTRGITTNRQILFDVAIAGPVAGLIITIIVTMYGAYTAPVIPAEIAQELYDNESLVPWQLGEPLLMTGALAVFGKGDAGTEVLMTPLLFAAWFGYLITFLNMLPAWQLDGGHMARTLFGKKWHRIATYASVGVLIWPLQYWLMGLMILFLSARNTSAPIMDDISPLPRSRKYAYVVIIGLAILCAPLPASIPLGIGI